MASWFVPKTLSLVTGIPANKPIAFGVNGTNLSSKQKVGRSNEDALKVLREIDEHLHEGLDVLSSCRKAGILNKAYYYWRKKVGGLTIRR